MLTNILTLNFVNRIFWLKPLPKNFPKWCRNWINIVFSNGLTQRSQAISQLCDVFSICRQIMPALYFHSIKCKCRSSVESSLEAIKMLSSPNKGEAACRLVSFEPSFPGPLSPSGHATFCQLIMQSQDTSYQIRGRTLQYVRSFI